MSLAPAGGGAPEPIPSITADDVLICATADGRSVLAYRNGEVPTRVVRIDLETGVRTPVGEIAPVNRVGPMGALPTSITDDEQSYAYWTWWLP